MSQDDPDPDERQVRAEVRRFKQHLLTYLAVLAAMVMVHVAMGGAWGSGFWFFWIAFFWGVAIAFQAARLFGDEIGKEWEDRMVHHILARRREEASAPYTPPEPPRPPPPSSSGPPSGPPEPPAP